MLDDDETPGLPPNVLDIARVAQDTTNIARTVEIVAGTGTKAFHSRVGIDAPCVSAGGELGVAEHRTAPMHIRHSQLRAASEKHSRHSQKQREAD